MKCREYEQCRRKRGSGWGTPVCLHGFSNCFWCLTVQTKGKQWSKSRTDAKEGLNQSWVLSLPRKKSLCIIQLPHLQCSLCSLPFPCVSAGIFLSASRIFNPILMCPFFSSFYFLGLYLPLELWRFSHCVKGSSSGKKKKNFCIAKVDSNCTFQVCF